MANRQKKLEEKYQKQVRDLAALPENKHCFDCHQRGPTYINMTIGSFVCTACSGILRGLNPPHRVKSISMATFSGDEVDQLQQRGNNYCKQVWLGLYDASASSTARIAENLDAAHIKDFLIMKYERKRWYVSPNEIARQQQLIQKAQEQRQQQRPTGTIVDAAKSNQNDIFSLVDTDVAAPIPDLSNIQGGAGKAQHQRSAFSLMDNDPFASPTKPPTLPTGHAGFGMAAPPQPPTAQPPPVQASAAAGFADFANFDTALTLTSTSSHTQFPTQPAAPIVQPQQQRPPPGFGQPLVLNGNTKSSSVSMPSGFAATHTTSAPIHAAHPEQHGPPAGQGGDKYSALAELDHMFSSSPGRGGGVESFGAPAKPAAAQQPQATFVAPMISGGQHQRVGAPINWGGSGPMDFTTSQAGHPHQAHPPPSTLQPQYANNPPSGHYAQNQQAYDQHSHQPRIAAQNNWGAFENMNAYNATQNPLNAAPQPSSANWNPFLS